MVSRARDKEHRSRRSGGAVRRKRRGWLWLLWVPALLSLCGALAIVLFLQSRGIAPRALGPYVGLRATGHNPVIEQIGESLERTLLWLDRGTIARNVLPQFGLGAHAGKAQAGPAAGREVMINDAAELRAAMFSALPGDVISLMPGTYRFSETLKTRSAGTAQAPIVVRARELGQVKIELGTQEGFNVSQPWWRFENLVIVGICTDDAYCEHAFHVVGKAAHFVSLNNSIANFNAHFKINGENGNFPDAGLIESNTLFNTAVRATRNPVTPVDLVAASNWMVRANVIHDFIKGQGDQVSYGAFFKGAGARNVFDQNVVICELQLQGAAGQRIGLSLGGGGSGHSYCRDRKCITEQEDSILRNNLIMACSDDGMYINSAARSQIVHNTLLDTGGISVRFPSSSADVQGNLIDGAVRSRDGGVLRASDNAATATGLLYAGWHPVRSLYRASAEFDLNWADDPPRRAEGSNAPARDLCGAARPAAARYGAFESIAACRTP